MLKNASAYNSNEWEHGRGFMNGNVNANAMSLSASVAPDPETIPSERGDSPTEIPKRLEKRGGVFPGVGGLAERSL